MVVGEQVKLCRTGEQGLNFLEMMSQLLATVPVSIIEWYICHSTRVPWIVYCIYNEHSDNLLPMHTARPLIIAHGMGKVRRLDCVQYPESLFFRYPIILF